MTKRGAYCIFHHLSPFSFSFITIHYCRLGHIAVLRYMITCRGVDPDVTNEHGQTLLFTAVVHKQLEVVHYLLAQVCTFIITKYLMEIESSITSNYKFIKFNLLINMMIYD